LSAAGPHIASPLLAYRWVDTDRALTAQLELEAEGHAVTLSPGHAAVRFTNPATGGDVLPTLRTEMHRVRQAAATLPRREVGSSVYQVFDGSGSVFVGDRTWAVARGDLFVVPSWTSFTAKADTASALDLFRFSDAPIFEALHAHRADPGAPS
jgi:gentisate 1,2-dioxygenase